MFLFGLLQHVDSRYLFGPQSCLYLAWVAVMVWSFSIFVFVTLHVYKNGVNICIFTNSTSQISEGYCDTIGLSCLLLILITFFCVLIQSPVIFRGSGQFGYIAFVRTGEEADVVGRGLPHVS